MYYMRHILFFISIFISLASFAEERSYVPTHGFESSYSDDNGNVIRRLSKDYNGDMNMLQNECARGDNVACHLIGTNYLLNNQEYDGIEILDKNCNNGFIESCETLSIRYADKNIEKMLYYHQKICQLDKNDYGKMSCFIVKNARI